MQNLLLALLHSHTSWKARYFVLTTQAVHYFRRSEGDELFGEARGRLPIDQIELSSSTAKPLRFTLTTPSKTRVLRASTPEEAQTWIKAILEVQKA